MCLRDFWYISKYSRPLILYFFDIVNLWKFDFEIFISFSLKTQSKTNLLSAKKVEKMADNKAQFELKNWYFFVFQGRRDKNQKHPYYRSKMWKKYSVIGRKNNNIYPKTLKNTLIIGLTILQSGRLLGAIWVNFDLGGRGRV